MRIFIPVCPSWVCGRMATTSLSTCLMLITTAPTGRPRGVKVYALNRADLTAGVASFMYEDFYLTEGKGYEHLVPSNLLGDPPPAGTPNYFAAIDTGKFYIWEFHVDWSNPAYSTFGTDRGWKPPGTQ